MLKSKWIIAVAALIAMLVLGVGCADAGSDDTTAGLRTDRSKPASCPADAVNNVKEYLQMPLLAGGCEVASLACVLEAMGFEVDPEELVDEHLAADDGSGFASSYIGSPYVFGCGFPPVLARCANSFFEHQGSDMRAVSMRGFAFKEVLAELDRGYPIMVWTTMEMMPVYHTETFSDGFEWYDNEHCVVVYGADDQKVLVSDPLNGLVERDRDVFEEIFEECGGMAVAFREKP